MWLSLSILHLGALSLAVPAGARPELSMMDSLLARDRLTGDWGGGRSALIDSGLTVEALIIQEFFSTPSGGVDQGTTYSRFAQIDFGFDLERLLGVPDAAAFASGYHVDGTGVSSNVGDFQGVSNIEADQLDILAELWWEQRLVDDRLRVKVGKLDANSEFAYTDVASEFVNSSMGFSPTIFVFPTYPFPAWAAVVEAKLNEDLSLRLGVFDGAVASGLDTGATGPSFLKDHPTSAFWIAEANTTWGREFPGRLGIGGWLHTEDFIRFDGGIEDDATGAHLVFDQRVWNAPGGRHAALFAQLGLADEEVSEVGAHLGFGAVYTNSETNNILGLGVTAIEFSDAPAAGFSEDYEVAIEAFWRFQPLEWLSLKPDVQYIVNPGGSRSIDNALALGIRLEWLL